MTQIKEQRNTNGYFRVLEFDFIRCAACFAVVTLHITGGVLVSLPKFSFPWSIALTITSATRMAVPLFVMIRGYFLLRKTYATNEIPTFYKKRCFVALIPLIFWTIFYFLFALVRKPYILKTLDVSIGEWLQTGMPPGGYHLWYLYMLIGLYLIAPLLSVWFQAFSAKYLTWVSVLTLFLISFNATVCLFLERPSNLPILFKFVAYIPYFLLGRLLGETINQSPKACLPYIGFIGYILSTLGVVVVYALTGRQFFLENFSPFVCAQALSFYVFAVSWKTNPTLKCARFIPYLASLSFGTYLLHIFYLGVFGALCRKFISPDRPLVSMFTMIVAVYFLSNATTAVVKKIPYLRRVV